MDILGIIPARFQSSRFPGKPLVKIDGKTMIQRVWEQSSKVLNHLVVATDNEGIKNEVESFGGIALITDENHKTGTDRCAEALLSYQKNHSVNFDIVLNIQGDEPFINPEQIRQLIAVFKEGTIQIGTLVKVIRDQDELLNPNQPKVVLDKHQFALYFSRSPVPYIQNENQANWLKKHSFYKHVGMYGYRSNILLEISKLKKTILEQAESLEQLRWLESGYKIHTAVTDIDSFSVDSIHDLEKIKEKGLFINYELPST